MFDRINLLVSKHNFTLKERDDGSSIIVTLNAEY